MIIHPLIAGAVLLVALAACDSVEVPATDPARQEAAAHVAGDPELADAQVHGFERALRTAARE